MTDARRWDGFQPREGDVVVATYPKCGTTWTQRIVDLLIHQTPDPRPIMQFYPWLDATFFAPIEADLATLEAQTHRRAIKSHLPFDSLPIYEGMKYIHVARDGRDACFSFHNHESSYTPEVWMGHAARAAENPMLQVRPKPEPDLGEYYRRWIDEAEDEAATGLGVEMSFFDYEMTYWRERRLPNLLLVHYADLKADLPGEMARISDFLEIETPPAKLAELAEAARFEAMKSQGDALLPALPFAFQGGHKSFLHKGTNGRWKDVLTDADLARFDRLSTAKFTPSARAWIEGGRLAAGDPAELPD
ncbi:sulfotransferase domain-containing protein [uncultured Phenylobacterium sp.]|uniref:sulfotransferase domain-containing protein n=1 Tax=uncultured Phenylobacterium sp. TaxID=349273 RepID=UPI0025E593D2|nr:sulfotransferase domain-containing protein [uncultured Phenylobacterium sp.]